ncbi:MAG: hypothetical protein FJW63_09860 [Actinobacteria bacterium]|nr:hypothetical protein [Actinomycetota bacterium]
MKKLQKLLIIFITLTLILSFSVSCLPEVNPGWVKVGEWKGGSSKTTETFTIKNKEWKISWKAYNLHGGDYRYPKSFDIFVTNADNILDCTELIWDFEPEGSAYMERPPGKYYLNIYSANIKWKVTVEEKR